MRTIKFRAWDTINKKMVQDVSVGEGRVAVTRGLDPFRNIADLFLLSEGWLIPMQFTGLLDKNGTEIWEGDIVKNNRYGGFSEILWKQGEPSTAGKIQGVFGEDNDLTGFISSIGSFIFSGLGKFKGRTRAHFVEDFEVIGNIYENPDLLK